NADIEPPNASLAIVVKRKPDTNIHLVRTALYALATLWTGTSPELLAGANEVLSRTPRARPLRDAFAVIRVEVECVGATGAERQAELVHCVSFWRIIFEESTNVARLGADPPLA